MENAPPSKSILAVYDFDNTLFNTPHPKEGIEKFESITGKMWAAPKYKWWDSKYSLIPPFFVPSKETANLGVIERFYRDRANTEVYTVMMTGRKAKLANEVKRILQDFNIFPNEYFFRHQEDLLDDPNYPKYDTFKYKAYVIENRLMSPNIHTVEIYEDRTPHVELFLRVGEKLKNKFPNLETFVVHDVKNEKSCFV